MSSRAIRLSKMILKLLLAITLIIVAYYALEGASALLSASPVFAAPLIALLALTIILGALSLLT